VDRRHWTIPELSQSTSGPNDGVLFNLGGTATNRVGGLIDGEFALILMILERPKFWPNRHLS